MKFVLMMIVFASAMSAHAAPAQAPKLETKCAAYARSLMKTAFKRDTKGIFELVEVKTFKVHEVPSDSDVQVERLTYMSDGATVIIESMPNYYGGGECELRSINISRE
jgi:hypothetical protein